MNSSRNLFQFAFFTGLRISELIGLRWTDIDWNNQLMSIEETIVAKELKGPKTEAGKREILLLSSALEALERQKEFTGLKKAGCSITSCKQRNWVMYRKLVK
ncbi:tyrosine-type recombinase/integrase [Legionella taurinensis]|uniref:tyrosine-type recombinase/integrase n=1 Tax=Legionella taurinensis TaxID=70611 RepID=UPI001F5EFB2C|nr:tyrosine-type recombinase/integrase [Legionella taurinensis]